MFTTPSRLVSPAHTQLGPKQGQLSVLSMTLTLTLTVSHTPASEQYSNEKSSSPINPALGVYTTILEPTALEQSPSTAEAPVSSVPDAGSVSIENVNAVIGTLYSNANGKPLYV